jgi:hypothetical protein
MVIRRKCLLNDGCKFKLTVGNFSQLLLLDRIEWDVLNLILPPSQKDCAISRIFFVSK